MTQTARDLIHSYEHWWKTLSCPTLHDVEECAHTVLRLLGWEHYEPVPMSGIKPEMTPLVYRVFHEEQPADILLCFFPPLALEPPSEVVGRGNDYPRNLPFVLPALRRLGARFAYVTDLYRNYIYDLETEDLVLHADTPRGFASAFHTVLPRTSITRGSLESLRRPPRSALARSLREWCQRWVSQLCNYCRLTEDRAELLLDRFVVLRFLFKTDILAQGLSSPKDQMLDIVQDVENLNYRGTGRKVASLFRALHQEYGMDFFEMSPEVEAALIDRDNGGSLLGELMLHCEGKFTIPVVLESFNYGEPVEKMRVRIVPDVNEERETYLARQTSYTAERACIEIDLADEGYRAIMYWFDKLLEMYERTGTAGTPTLFTPSTTGGELDLFSWSEGSQMGPEVTADRLALACERGFRLYYATSRQWRTARLIFTLHLIEWYKRLGRKVARFPRVDAVLVKRPPLFGSDRNFLQQHNSFGRVTEMDE
jgi:hypothetical protein